MTRTRHILLALYVVPRLLFLAWLWPFPSTVVYPDMEPHLDGPALMDGRWVSWAKDLARHDLRDHWEDLGVSVSLNGLHAVGVPYIPGFRLFCVGLIALGGVLVWLLYPPAAARFGARPAFVALAAVSLYPRGIYFSSYFISFYFAVLAAGLVAVLLARQRELMEGAGRAALGLVAAAALLTWLYFCRRSVSAVMIAAVVGLALNGAWRKAQRAHFLLFAAALFGFVTLGKAVMPASGHLVWHHVYRGLTNFGNKWNVKPGDDDMQATARAIDPNLSRESIWGDPGYEKVYHDLLFQAVRQHPGWWVELLAKRAARLVVLPRSGGWLPKLADDRMKDLVPVGGLIRGTEFFKLRMYVTFYTLTMLADAAIVFTGFLALAGAVRRYGVRTSLPWFVLMGSVLYVYVLIDAQYNDVYMAGTYFYVFAAGALAGERCRDKAPR